MRFSSSPADAAGVEVVLHHSITELVFCGANFAYYTCANVRHEADLVVPILVVQLAYPPDAANGVAGLCGGDCTGDAQ